MRATLLLLVALVAPALADQVVWKWVDKDGVTHYSDRPVAGATRVELNVGSRSEPPPPPSPSSSAPRASTSPRYQTFEITSPRNDESVINTGGRVNVSIRVEPGLQPGHTLLLYMDGRRIEGSAQNAQDYTLNEVPRGTHNLVAVIENSGTRVRETAPVTFHVRQESAAQPPVGPALRSPPKPQRRGSNKVPSSPLSYATLNGQRTQIDSATNAPKA